VKTAAILCLLLLGCSTGGDATGSNASVTCISEWEGPLDPSLAPFEIELCLREGECTVGELPSPSAGSSVVVSTGRYHWAAAWTRDATLETGAEGRWVRVELQYDPADAEALRDDDRTSLSISAQDGEVMVDVTTTYGPGDASWDGEYCRWVARHFDGSALYSTDAEPCAEGYIPDPTQRTQDPHFCQPCAPTGAQCIAGVDGICRDVGASEFCCNGGQLLQGEPEAACESAP